MPISEDEFDYRHHQDSTAPQATMSKAELRKTHKPIMEKRRRARINHCLNEIKSLILEAMNKDPARHSKLEKADILEMAVKHLQNVQRQQLAMAMASDPSVLRKFKSGFSECATEIDRYVNQIDGVDNGVKDRMRSHLNKCITGIEQLAHFNFPTFANLPFVPNVSYNANNSNLESATTTTTSSGDQNNNARIQMPQSIQLIPSRLPSGEIALVLPNSNNLPFLPNLAARERPSAFATVVPSSTAASNALANDEQSPPASPEIRGFRPVKPTFEQQVQQVTSTSVPPPLEVKSIKFPIHSYPEKEAKKFSSPKKVEPLCIITNQSERYKQAHVREDGADFEENRHQQLGTKRKFGEMLHHGLLTFVPQEPAAKVPKIEVLAVEPGEQQPSTSRDNNNDSNNGDMWRPW